MTATLSKNSKIALVVVTIVAIVVAFLVATSGKAEATDSNQAEFWQNQPGEICQKVDDTGAEEGSYTVPAEETGRNWSTLIIKKGSGNNGTVENQVFENPVAGQSYTWIGAAQGGPATGGWSHIILCSIPEPAPEEPESVTPVPPTFTDSCGPDNEVLTLPTQTGVVFTSTESPSGTFTVVATPADDTFVVTGTSTWTFVANDEVCPTTPVTPEVPVVTPETPVVTPTVPTDEPTETPETPVANPPKPPKDVQVTECVDGVFVTTVNGEVVSESGSCDEETSVASTPVPAQEEGL